ncbi:hypothetical protein CNYM01_12666, partial [Colletotrichum nymphaeae SA-01]
YILPYYEHQPHLRPSSVRKDAHLAIDRDHRPLPLRAGFRLPSWSLLLCRLLQLSSRTRGPLRCTRTQAAFPTEELFRPTWNKHSQKTAPNQQLQETPETAARQPHRFSGNYLSKSREKDILRHSLHLLLSKSTVTVQGPTTTAVKNSTCPRPVRTGGNPFRPSHFLTHSRVSPPILQSAIPPTYTSGLFTASRQTRKQASAAPSTVAIPRNQHTIFSWYWTPPFSFYRQELLSTTTIILTLTSISFLCNVKRQASSVRRKVEPKRCSVTSRKEQQLPCKVGRLPWVNITHHPYSSVSQHPCPITALHLVCSPSRCSYSLFAPRPTDRTADMSCLIAQAHLEVLNHKLSCPILANPACCEPLHDPLSLGLDHPSLEACFTPSRVSVFIPAEVF